ncbi:MAG: magnesium transporter [Clostridiales bacterium]|nr:magnesium transporter [Clostridiales bacterium]
MRNNVNELLDSREFGRIRVLFTAMEPADIAELLGEIDEQRLPILFRILPKELAAETFVEMDSDEQELLINAFSERELHDVVEELFVDDAVDIIEEMPANVVKRILRHTDSEMRNSINEILRYPKDSAGSIMTTEYVSLKKDMTVSEAFDRIRRTGVDKETIYTCYVTDTDRKLIGLVTVKELLLSPYNTVINTIMEKNIISVETLDDKEEVANMFDKYDFMSLPVVDKENRLVGIVTFDDAIDVIQEENTEDIQKMGALQPIEETYLKTPVWRHAKNRIVWLLLLMLSATITGSIIENYEAAFTALPILVAFIPMLMDTGGNCGAQSSTMIIRGLALDEITPKDIMKIMFKEIRIAVVVGLILAAVNTLRIYIMYSGQDPLFLSAVTGLSLIATVVIAKMLGGVLPILAKLCKLDPALMASPLITTIVDTCSVIIFFNIALWIMSWGI